MGRHGEVDPSATFALYVRKLVKPPCFRGTYKILSLTHTRAFILKCRDGSRIDHCGCFKLFGNKIIEEAVKICLVESPLFLIFWFLHKCGN